MDPNQISKVKAAIVAELARQAPNVYFWDRSDEELFDGGPIEIDEYLNTKLQRVVSVADKFDMDAVAACAIRALED